ncbi:hypothetical protein WT24_30550 [Burkholderia sp. MSMB1078WGS]|uniref:hypothetical protein n=1 Tax=Burkholderia sp. MSMB1078WGS TaxID=1637900 RepID=UPI00075299E0|nr:hypothetical protein [Burkholderia sp. MSMB1078WGS]KVT18565.1 hypothetical protein WT24_30550 [Burkholderia sp. MSMB1078WGS]
MRVLPNRSVRARDAWRAVLNARAESRHATCCRCRECGFVAFRALEHCPVCGQWNWPFEPIRRTPADARAAHAPRSFHTWSSRVARALRNAASQRPRASSAPILSILTLVLLVGGYVTVDQTCKADPACRGSAAPAAVATEAVLQASNEPLIPVVPAPVYPFHSTDETRVAVDPPQANPQPAAPLASKPARRMAVAQAAPSLRAPDRMRTGAVRVADWKGGRDVAHRTHAIRRVSLHTGRTRRAAASNAEIAKLYRGH